MRIQHFVQLLVANWVLVSFLFVLVIALYVKFRFGTDYFFQSYRDAKTTKELSGFHQQIGDRMMAFQGWKAAEEAYRAALQVDPTNTAATFGIVKAQVFDPLPGQAFIDPEIVDVRLEYLLSRFPDDYQVHFLKALRCCQRGEVQEALIWLRTCVEQQPGFVGPYLLQGDIAFQRSDIEEAAAHYSRAVELDPNSPVAKNNLAACHVLLSDFQAGVEAFDAALKLERGPAFRRTFQNRMQSAENLVKMPDNTKAWLLDHRKLLA